MRPGQQRGEQPAFPVENDAFAEGYPAGMSIREEFAKAALQGLCANPVLFNEPNLRAIVVAAGRGPMTPAAIVAMLAAQHADLLLAELGLNP